MAQKKKKTVRKDGLMEKVYQGKHFYGRSDREIQEKIIAWSNRQQGTLPFCEIADAYERYITGPTEPLRPGTLRSYLPHIKKAVEHFGEKPIQEITPTDVRAWLERLKFQGYSAKTITNCKGVLSCIFSFWCAEMHGTANPTMLCGLPHHMKASAHRQPPTAQQLQAINAAPDGEGFWAQLFRYTGLRLGEAMALTWQDVDLNADLIHVTKACLWNGNRPYLTETKTENALRVVPILKPFRAMLLAQKVGHAETDYLLSGTAQPLTQSQYRNRWIRYCRDIGIAHYYETPERMPATATRPERVFLRKEWQADVTAHQFRHFYATALFEAGVPDLVAQRLLGHADIMTTRRIYQHFREQTLPHYTELLNNYFETAT